MGKERGNLEFLYQLGIIRPSILRYLMEVRNNIEHNDAQPPALGRCNELLDIMWYFLRATDIIVQRKCTSIEYNLDDTDYIVNLYIDVDDNIEIATHGILPEQLISNKPYNGSIKIAIDEYRNINEQENYLKINTGKVFKGKIQYDDYQLLSFLRKYFSTY